MKDKSKHLQAKTKPKIDPPEKPGGSLHLRQLVETYMAMSRRIQTTLNYGSGGLLVDVECQLSNGLPAIVIVGLGNKAIDEAKDRIRSAFASSKLTLPRKRITINLAPADVPKESTSLDLAIALAILQADNQIKPDFGGTDTIIIGELGLNGDIRAVRGVIGRLLIGKRAGIRRFIVPKGNLSQAQLIPDIEVLPAESLHELCKQIQSNTLAMASAASQAPTLPQTYEWRLSDVAGQRRAKRAIEIAAAGGHNIYLSGPPGTGKSMMAKALPSILPALSRQEMLEVTHIHSLVSGNYDQLVTARPFRAPHHSASHVAIVGGGNNLRPGEISLAHGGVLFLDEMPEFARGTIEALRQPLEERSITVSRAKDTATYPAKFILVATANPCPCGFFGTAKPCICPPHIILRYRQKLSGPIMDRIDLYTEVENVEHERLLEETTTETDDAIRKRIQYARDRQQERFGSAEHLNATMGNDHIKSKSNLNTAAKAMLNEAAQALELSARSYMRVIKVARTIADLDGSGDILTNHVSEALQYRSQNIQALA